MAGQRARFGGTAEDLAKALGPFATNIRFLAYHEGDLATAKVDTERILKHSDLLASVRKLQPNLSFTKSLVLQAFQIVWANATFEADEEHKESWTTCMCARFRNLCRVTQQACEKKRPPKWALRLPWMPSGEVHNIEEADEETQRVTKRRRTTKTSPDEEQGDQKDDEKSEEKDKGSFFYGFDEELGMAYRARSATDRRELCLEIRPPTTKDPLDNMVAIFAGGLEYELCDWTLEDWQERHDKCRKGIERRDNFWEGEHTETHHVLRVGTKPQADRGELAYLEEQGGASMPDQGSTLRRRREGAPREGDGPHEVHRGEVRERQTQEGGPLPSKRR